MKQAKQPLGNDDLGLDSAPRTDRVKLSFECPKRWNELNGNGTSRGCSECQLEVHNLSAMRRAEAEAFLSTPRERTCVAYVPDAEGNVVCSDDVSTSPALAREWRPGWRLRAAAAVAALHPLLAACSGVDPKENIELPPVSGTPGDAIDGEELPTDCGSPGPMPTHVNIDEMIMGDMVKFDDTEFIPEDERESIGEADDHEQPATLTDEQREELMMLGYVCTDD